MKNLAVINTTLHAKRENLTLVEDKMKKIIATRNEIKKAIEKRTVGKDLYAMESLVTRHENAIKAIEKEKEGLKREIEELENNLRSFNRNKQQKVKSEEQRDNSEIKWLGNYVRAKGSAIQERAGFTSVEGGALIPEELLKPLEIDDTLDLSRYVNVAKVNSGVGKYPVIKKSGNRMNTVEELAANPELAKPIIDEVHYEIETYRGFIPVSQEVIDDAKYDIEQLIVKEIKNQEINTKNTAIATLLKTATPKTVAGLDGLISLLNKDITQSYNTKLYISSSLYNELDLLKDKTGHYLMQNTIAVATGKSFKGREVIVLDDDVIGSAEGDLKGFVGDAKAFITLFDRKRASIKWVENGIYGQSLAGFVRFDTKVVDEDAGFYITYTD